MWSKSSCALAVLDCVSPSLFLFLISLAKGVAESWHLLGTCSSKLLALASRLLEVLFCLLALAFPPSFPALFGGCQVFCV